MNRVLDQGESEINLLEGGSTIGMTNVTFVDKRVTPTDQRSGWFTQILSSSGNGQNQIMGRRILVEQQDPTTGAWNIIMDGVVGDITLNDDLVSYTLAVRDIRERERKIRAFDKSQGISLYPPGMINGYGRFGNSQGYTMGIDIPWLVPPVTAAKAKFSLDPAGGGTIGMAIITDDRFKLGADYMNGTFLPCCDVVGAYYDQASGLFGTYKKLTYANVRVHWRPQGSSGAFTILNDMPHQLGTAFSSWAGMFIWGAASANPGNAKFTGNDGVILSSNIGGTDLPTNGQLIELKIEYVGVPTEDMPLFIEKPFGQLLKDIYDGVYSSESPKIRYDATAMTALLTSTPYARAKITKPEEDMRDWVEKNIYKPLGMAPSIDNNGKIVPVKMTLPDPSVSLWQLDDSNIVKEGSGWVHSYADTANKISFKYKREVIKANDPNSAKSSIFNWALDERDVEFADISTSVALLGPHPVEYDPVTVRDIGTTTGGPITGNVFDETGTRLAVARALDIFDRFGYGVQKMVIRALRNDANVNAAKTGDWVQIASSWMPDYNSHQRGINRIGQIIAIKNIDPAVREFTILDGGPASAPLAQPGVGALSISNGGVLTPITSIPTGAGARVEYAVSPTLPGTNSGAWTLAGRISAPGNVVTPPQVANTVVWIRTRSEQFGRRPSTWTNAVSITIPISPVITDFKVILRDGSDPILQWNNISAAGLKITYAGFVKDGVIANPTTVWSPDVDATTQQTVLTGVRVQQFDNIIVKVTPYTAFGAGVASGTAGTPMSYFAQRNSDFMLIPGVVEVITQAGLVGTLEVQPSYDPQYRISKYEFRTRSGLGGTWSAWAVDATSPYSTTVVLIAGDTSHIEYRVSALDMNAAEVIVAQTSVAFVAGSSGASYLECRARLISATDTTEVIQVDAISPGGGTPQVQLVAVTGSAARIAGPALGTPSTTGTQWTFSRGAALVGTGSGQAQFRATQTGMQSDDDFCEIPEQGRDTIGLVCQATVTGQDKDTVSVTVLVVDPISQGGSAYISLIVSSSGVGSITPGTAFSMTTGASQTFVINRAVYLSGTGRVLFKATAANRVGDMDAVDVPSKDAINGLSMSVQQSAITSTTITYRVIVADPIPQGFHSLLIYQETGSGGFGSGTYSGTPTADFTLVTSPANYVDYTISRPTSGNPDTTSTFRAVVDTGSGFKTRAPVEMTVPIPAQGSTGGGTSGFSGLSALYSDFCDWLTVSWSYTGPTPGSFIIEARKYALAPAVGVPTKVVATGLSSSSTFYNSTTASDWLAEDIDNTTPGTRQATWYFRVIALDSTNSYELARTAEISTGLVKYFP
jgi:hypothetical protein